MPPRTRARPRSRSTGARDGEIERLLGALDERTEHFGAQLGELKDSVEKIAGDHSARLKSLEDDRTEAKGARRAVYAISGGIATLFAGITTAAIKLWPQG